MQPNGVNLRYVKLMHSIRSNNLSLHPQILKVQRLENLSLWQRLNFFLGIQGLRGETGAAGFPGSKGEKGDPGLPGLQGPQGAIGTEIYKNMIIMHSENQKTLE